MADLVRDPANAAAAAYLRAKSDAEAATANRKALYQQAIEATRQAYHLTPPVLDPATDPRFPEGLNKLSAWTPTYEERRIWDSNVGAVVQKTDEEIADLLRTSNNVLMSKDERPFDPVAGQTDPATGKIEVYGPAASDGKDASPDYLASIILHETRHWADYVARGGLRKNEIGVTAYENFVSDQKAYALQADFLQNTLKYPQDSKLVVDTRTKSNNYKGRAEQLDREGSKNLYLEDLRRDRRYKSWPEVRTPGFALSAGAEQPDNLERMRAVADHDFLGAYLDQATPVLAEAKRLGDEQAQEKRRQELEERQRLEKELEEKRRRDEELDAQEKEAETRRYTSEKAMAAAKACGFEYSEFQGRQEIQVPVSFNGMFWHMRYRLAPGLDMDQIKMGFAFLGKCLNAAIRNKPEEPFCGVMAERTSQRWNEPGFRDRLPLEDQNRQYPGMAGPNECLYALQTEIKIPMDAKQIAKIAKKGGQKWRDDYNRAEERERRSSRSGPSRPSPSNGGGVEGPGRGNAGNGGEPHCFMGPDGTTWNCPYKK